VRSTLAFAACCLAMGIAAPSFAEGRDPAAAEAVFKEGRKLAERGDYAAACPRFAESLRLDPAPGTRLNLADCEEHLGKLASAWQDYQRAIGQLAASDDRLSIARARVSALDRRIPRIVVKLPDDAPADTVVLKDDDAIEPGDLGLPVPIDPGEHTIVVRAKGHADRRYAVAMKEAELRDLDVDLGDGDGSAPRSSSRKRGAPTHGGGRTTVGLVVGGLGVVGLGVAAYTGLALRDRKQTVEAECDPVTKLCSDRGAQAAADGRTLLPINAAAWAVGVLGVGAGAYLLLTSDGGATRTAIGPALVAGGGGVELRRSF
jgi:hypothetical protein